METSRRLYTLCHSIIAITTLPVTFIQNNFVILINRRFKRFALYRAFSPFSPFQSIQTENTAEQVFKNFVDLNKSRTFHPAQTEEIGKRLPHP